MHEWDAISQFSRHLGVKEKTIKKAKQDFSELLKSYYETHEFVWEKHRSKRNESLSIQRFFLWKEKLLCFFTLILSGFRHAALRELRFYLEDSERSYYIDSRHYEKSYEKKVNLLRLFKPKKALTDEDKEILKAILGEKHEGKIRKRIGSKELLSGVPKEKQDEFEKFYSDLCDYVHLSEEAQTDATSDSGLNIALGLRFYEDDIKLLEKTFECSRYLLLKSLEKKG
jgi:hypothetical protein